MGLFNIKTPKNELEAMFIKEYLKLLSRTTFQPRTVFNKVINKEGKFHLLYYAIFNFILGCFLAIGITSNAEKSELSAVLGDNPFDIILIFLFGLPAFFFLISMYFEFVQSQIFKIEKTLISFFKTLLWSFHTFVLMILFSMFPLALIAYINNEYINYLVAPIMIVPFLYLAYFIFIGMTEAMTKSWWKTGVVLSLGAGLFALPIYLFDL